GEDESECGRGPGEPGEQSAPGNSPRRRWVTVHEACPLRVQKTRSRRLPWQRQTLYRPVTPVTSAVPRRRTGHGDAVRLQPVAKVCGLPGVPQRVREPRAR